jgi:hypothetical protein
LCSKRKDAHGYLQDLFYCGEEGKKLLMSKLNFSINTQ